MSAVSQYQHEIIVFATGFIIMMLELAGFAIVSPHFGNALTVSTNLIGIILASLAAGYIFGGWLSDKKAAPQGLFYIISGAALWIGFVFPLKDILSALIVAVLPDIRISSFLAILILFVPANVLLGAVLPYALKLKITKFSNSGKVTGRMYALSSLGSIAGTFAFGLLIIPRTNLEISLLAITLALLTLAYLLDQSKKGTLALIPLIALAFYASQNLNYERLLYSSNKVAIDGAIVIDRTQFKKLRDTSSQYNRIRVYEGVDLETGESIRLLRVNKEIHGGIFMDSDELIFKYAKFNQLAGHFNPDAKKALMIGGGSYMYPKFFLGDTPLHDIPKTWNLLSKEYANDGKLTVPVIATNDIAKRSVKPILTYQKESPPQESEREGVFNILEVENQKPGETVKINKAIIKEMGLHCNQGFVHVHELSKNSKEPEVGRVISQDVFIHKPGNVFAHSELFSGIKENLTIPLDRPTKEGEIIYLMLHRDNCNNRFDPIQVDGYEKTEFMDVVEIDPKITEAAKDYFGLDTKDPRLRIFHEDGRTYINRTKDKYDIIYIDAFLSFYNIPYQLTTQEAIRRLYAILNEGGIVLVNIPGALSGPNAKFFESEFLTFQSVFPYVRAYAVSSLIDESRVQNIILVAWRSTTEPRKTLNDDPEINQRLTHEWQGKISPNAEILTDEFAPVDYFNNRFNDIVTL